MDRFDMLDTLATRVFDIVEPGYSYAPDSDAYCWRWLCDELVQAMSDAQARELMEFIARMHDAELSDVE